MFSSQLRRSIAIGVLIKKTLGNERLFHTKYREQKNKNYGRLTFDSWNFLPRARFVFPFIFNVQSARLRSKSSNVFLPPQSTPGRRLKLRNTSSSSIYHHYPQTQHASMQISSKYSRILSLQQHETRNSGAAIPNHISRLQTTSVNL